MVPNVSGESGFSVICAYNDAAKLDKYLLPSIAKQQSAAVEVILLDNRERKYANAAPALNEAARGARYDYLLFAHQDISLISPLWLANARKWLGDLVDLGAAGPIGQNESGAIGNVMHGKPPSIPGHSTQLPREVQTLDGCLLIVPTAAFAARGFDTSIRLGWYLYVLDYCLDQIAAGLKCYVLPEWTYHLSTGPNKPTAYAHSLALIRKKHRAIGTIYSTIGVWSTET
jgi:hypothetical protein